MTAPVGQPSDPAGGAVWLGYSALVDAATPTHETSVLPVSDIELADFVCDVLARPLSTGVYDWPGQSIAAFIRIARLIVLDDVNQDGKFDVDDDGGMKAPDRLLATSASHLLLFVDRLPDDPSLLDGVFLHNWESAVLGYNLIQLDPGASSPSLMGNVVPSDTLVLFGAPSPAAGP